MHFASFSCYKMATNCSEKGCGGVTKRKKTRRGKRRRNLEVKRRFIDEYMRQRKHRVAPSNTTQFIMEDREEIEPILTPTNSLSSSSSPEGNMCSDIDMAMDEEADSFDEQFFLQDFETTYRQVQRDNLYSLSKQELLEKVQSLESQRDCLEKECFELAVERNNSNVSKSTSSDSLKREVKQLQVQNNLLREENEELKRINRSSSSTSEQRTSEAVCGC